MGLFDTCACWLVHNGVACAAHSSRLFLLGAVCVVHFCVAHFVFQSSDRATLEERTLPCCPCSCCTISSASSFIRSELRFLLVYVFSFFCSLTFLFTLMTMQGKPMLFIVMLSALAFCTGKPHTQTTQHTLLLFIVWCCVQQTASSRAAR